MGFKKKVFIDQNELAREFDAPALPTFSEKELEKFGERLNQFRVPREVRKMNGEKGRETVLLVDIQEAMVAFGAMTKTLHNGVPTYAVRLKPTDFDKHGNPSQYLSPTLLDYFNNKYEQWIAMMSRRAFVEAKKIEGLQELADTMGVGESFTEETV